MADSRNNWEAHWVGINNCGAHTHTEKYTFIRTAIQYLDAIIYSSYGNFSCSVVLSLPII